MICPRCKVEHDSKFKMCDPCRIKNRELTNAYNKANPERIKKIRERSYQNNKEKRRYRNIMARFGLTKEQYEAMLEAQGGTCAICDMECVSGRHLAIDHDHETGEIRKLLCTNCNTAIGKLGDSSDLAQRAVEYLRKHGK